MKKVTIILAAILVLGVSNLVAQDTYEANHAVGITIPAVKLVDLEDGDGNPASDLTWELSASDFGSEAGLLTTEFKNENTYFLQYTSIVENADASNKITAQLNSSTIPAAATLKVRAGSSVQGNDAKGLTGKGGNSYVALSTDVAEPIVDGIKSCITGSGGQNGHVVNYRLKVDLGEDFQGLYAGNYAATVLYTIVGQ